MTDHRNTTPIYRRLARLMAMLPATTKDIAEETGVTQRGLGLWTRHLRAEGIIGYGAMRQREGRLIVPGNGHRYALAKIEASAGVQTWCRAWHALAARQTSDSLAAVLGIGRRTACDLLRQLRLNGLIRVGGWEVRGQSYAPVWDRLPAPDVPKPGREPRTEINARFWAARRERMAANQQQLEAA
jgi:hypothetical protein